jgi:two-component system, LytTR family, sensor kinase
MRMRLSIFRLITGFLIFYLLVTTFRDGSKLLGAPGDPGWLTADWPIKSTNVLSFVFDTITSYLIFFYLYQRKGVMATVFIYVLAGVPLMIGFRYVMQEIIGYSLFGVHNYNPAMLDNLTLYFVDNIYFAIFYSAFGIVFFLLQSQAYNQLQQKELKLQARNAELLFLRSQVNPHFLFNSLNNIYALVYHRSANSLPAISKLSELLRYMLYEKADTVPLQKEIDYLRNYIELQLLRYDFKPSLKIDIESPENQALSITPLTLIPFVENAFKHGCLKDPAHPLTIDLKVLSSTLYLNVCNKKNNSHKDVTGGIGIENVSKRLALLYKQKFDLTITDNHGIFHVILKMELNE